MKNVFSPELSVFVNFSEKFCKNRPFLPYLEFLDRFRRDLVENVFSASLQRLAVILAKNG